MATLAGVNATVENAMNKEVIALLKFVTLGAYSAETEWKNTSATEMEKVDGLAHGLSVGNVLLFKADQTGVKSGQLIYVKEVVSSKIVKIARREAGTALGSAGTTALSYTNAKLVQVTEIGVVKERKGTTLVAGVDGLAEDSGGHGIELTAGATVNCTLYTEKLTLGEILAGMELASPEVISAAATVTVLKTSFTTT